MATWTALTTIAGEPAAAALGAAMEELLDPAPTGVGVFEIEDGSGLWEVGGYFLARPDPAALSVLAAVHGARDFTVSRVEDRDWVAQVNGEPARVHRANGMFRLVRLSAGSSDVRFRYRAPGLAPGLAFASEAGALVRAGWVPAEGPVVPANSAPVAMPCANI